MYFSFFLNTSAYKTYSLHSLKVPHGGFRGLLPHKKRFQVFDVEKLPRTAKPQSVDRNIKALIETSKR